MLDMLEDLREVDRIARWCVSHNQWVVDPHDAYQEARSAILERVAEAVGGAEVTGRDLVEAGKRAIGQMVAADRGDDQSKPRVRSYWAPVAADPSEERIVERLALAEVFSSLTPWEQQQLLTFAAHGSAATASAHLGLTRNALTISLGKARRTFFDRWFDWEQPPPLPRLPSARGERLHTHCSRGHEFTPENTVRMTGMTSRALSGRRCRACRIEEGRRRRERRAEEDAS